MPIDLISTLISGASSHVIAGTNLQQVQDAEKHRLWTAPPLYSVTGVCSVRNTGISCQVSMRVVG
jgi:hypothetical protein